MEPFDLAQAKAERDLARRATQHHIQWERELERLLSAHIALAAQKRKQDRCKCECCKSLRAVGDELARDA